MAKQRLDLTTGKPIKQILLFSLPLVMGSLFQQMYSFVDTIMGAASSAARRWQLWAVCLL